MAKLALALAILLCAVVSTSAKEKEGFFMGAGTTTCAEFGNIYQVDPQMFEEQFFAWAQGFMSGLNAGLRESRNLNSIPVDQQQWMIRDYCNQHPLATYLEAVGYLFAQFSKNLAPNFNPWPAFPRAP